MNDFCRCKGCSSERQLSKLTRQSFPKRLLVAVTVVVILAMCVMPAEARHLPEHRRRHRRPERNEPTKEMRLIDVHNRRRHSNRADQRAPEMMQMKQKGQIVTRGPKNTLNDLYYNQTQKILSKLRNTRWRFIKDKGVFENNEIKEYKNAIPPWLPTVSFVKLHKENYRNTTRWGRLGTTIPERKFRNLMPKLYKSLVEYEEVFKRLQAVELNFPDDPYKSYSKKRTQILNNTLFYLYSTIQEVKERMATVKLHLPIFNKKLNLSTLETKVDATQCLRNDYLALRGYGNLLHDWFNELKCPIGKNSSRQACKRYETKLLKKSSRRKDKESPNRVSGPL